MVQIVPTASLVIPAHNEQLGLARLLPLLLSTAGPGELQIIVVCNGCSDNSAATAASFGDDVEVLDLARPSKAEALVAGAARIRAFPVLYIDADVAIDTSSVRALVRALGEGKPLAAAPVRELDREGVSRLAGWYYDVWELLPNVRSGLFGRGVIALSEEGYRRTAALPHFLSDDLAFSESFRVHERTIVGSAHARVWPARSWRALLQRRIRVAVGVRELRHGEALSSAAATHPRDLLEIVRERPLYAPRVLLFLGTAVIARFASHRRPRGGARWQRDESSRVSL